MVGLLLVTISYPAMVRNDAVKDHLAANQASLASAVRTITANNPIGERLRVEDLPPALAAPNIKLVICGASHVNLIVSTSPDTMSGFRVWIDEPMDDFADRPTSLPRVYRFSYCNDYPISNSNRPD